MCLNNRFSKKTNLYRGKDAVNKFIQAILNEYNYCRREVMKHFCKNLIMSTEEGKRFEQTNICWTCNKLFDVSEIK